ncbi:MAG: carbohydrate ABC transporter permease [Christensenellales bacterium]|jgi:putative aldouronate transport system permease protein
MVKNVVANKNKICSSKSDKVFDATNITLSILALLIVLVPLIHIVACSFSSGSAVQSGRVTVYPVEFTLTAYDMVFQYRDIWIGYRNTIYYTVVGTVLNVACTILAAYPLSRQDLIGNSLIMRLMIFTMMFSGGLIPSYLLVKDLRLLNTSWALWLPGLFSVYNMIVMRTFFRTTIPLELLEAAQMDGCTNRRFLWSIVIPLSGTIIAVMVLFYAIGHWNNYFSSMLYITTKSKYPLQLFLREILIASEIDYSAMTGSTVKEMLRKQELKLLMKYAIIVVSSAPVLCMYPFVQKYLVKGVMIGSIKG